MRAVKQTETVQARWVCQVVRSGYHNGAGCYANDPHPGWACGWRCEVSIPVPSAEHVAEVSFVTGTWQVKTFGTEGEQDHG